MSPISPIHDETQKTITLTETESQQPTTTIPLPAHHPHSTKPAKPGQPAGKEPPQPNPSTPLYFAYGSNLSPTQMRKRCTFHPAFSGKPVALARLDNWRWLICERGYANVFPPEELRVHPGGEGFGGSDGDEDENIVYGMLYEMARDDERLLDGYEDVDWDAEPTKLGDKIPAAVRPMEQGRGDYNKWYLPAKVVNWLDEEQRLLRGDREVQTVLVYVDEESVRVGRPNQEYIPRMDRAIREAEELGFPKKWADKVMKRFL